MFGSIVEAAVIEYTERFQRPPHVLVIGYFYLKHLRQEYQYFAGIGDVSSYLGIPVQISNNPYHLELPIEYTGETIRLG